MSDYKSGQWATSYFYMHGVNYTQVFVGLKLKYPFLECTLLILDYHQYYNMIIFFSPLRVFVQRKMQTYFQNLHFGGSMGESYIILWKWWFDCSGYFHWINVDQRVEFITFLLMALMRQYNYIFLPLPKYCRKVQSTRNFEKFELDVLK